MTYEIKFPLWPTMKPGKPNVLYETDTAFHSLFDTAQEATQMTDRTMRRLRHFNIPQTIRQIASVPGDAAEVGCFRGESAYLACSTFQTIGREIRFHIFDSFQGLSELKDVDVSAYTAPQQPGAPALFACEEDVVRENLKAFPFIEYHSGWVPERFDDVADLTFCYVHIDVDLFEPTDASIRFFWSRLSPGGAILLDDHGTHFWPGARKATEAFLAGRDDAFLLESPSGSAVVVKLR